MSFYTPEIRVNSQDQDVVVLRPGDRLQAEVAPGGTLVGPGWRGGLWVQYVTPVGPNMFEVDASNGLNVAGFLLRASERPPPFTNSFDGRVYTWGSEYNLTGIQPGSNIAAKPVSLITGGGRFIFRIFESLLLVGPNRTGALKTYTLNETLFVSERGFLTNDQGGELTGLIGTPVPVGTCSMAPSVENGFRLGLDLKY